MRNECEYDLGNLLNGGYSSSYKNHRYTAVMEAVSALYDDLGKAVEALTIKVENDVVE